MSPWMLLFIAIAVEVVGAVNLKFSDGFTRPLPTDCAIWAGAGTALVAMIGVIALGESLSALRAVSLVLVIAGIVGLNLAGAH